MSKRRTDREPREQIIDLTNLPKRSRKYHPPMATTPANTRLGEIPRGPSFTKNNAAQNVQLSPEDEQSRLRDQESKNRQLEADNPHLRGSVFTPKKPSKAQVNAAFKTLDESAKAYMALKKQFELDE